MPGCAQTCAKVTFLLCDVGDISAWLQQIPDFHCFSSIFRLLLPSCANSKFDTPFRHVISLHEKHWPDPGPPHRRGCIRDRRVRRWYP